jgi:mannose-6-phosphate isomerase-like protein (cupin superfamily)
MTLRVARADPFALIAEPDNHLRLSPLLSADDCGGALSVTWVAIDGRHRRLRTHRSTRLYAVLDGALRIECDGEPAAVLVSGEVAAIPRGAAYALTGTATYLVVNAPAFIEGDDEYLD